MIRERSFKGHGCKMRDSDADRLWETKEEEKEPKRARNPYVAVSTIENIENQRQRHDAQHLPQYATRKLWIHCRGRRVLD